jgi:S-adenosylmethionine-diacylgycerolhomoserine-N-methlytransferase
MSVVEALVGYRGLEVPVSTAPGNFIPCDIELPVERFYRFQAPFYDVTRWPFLFGRTELLHRIAAVCTPQRVLEVGCGTGRNVTELGRIFPRTHVTGVDVSSAMLAVAQKRTVHLGERVKLLRRRYDRPANDTASYNVVLFSYSLSMFNPGFETAVEAAQRLWISMIPRGRCSQPG